MLMGRGELEPLELRDLKTARRRDDCCIKTLEGERGNPTLEKLGVLLSLV